MRTDKDVLALGAAFRKATELNRINSNDNLNLKKKKNPESV